MIEDQIWLPVVGYAGIYEVSNRGNVRRILSGQGTQCGVLRISSIGKYKGFRLCREGKSKLFYAHKLVAEAFIPNPNKKLCVNHIDGDKTNNCLENLEWCSYSENMGHSFKNNLHPKGYSHYNSKISDEDVVNIRKDTRKQSDIAGDYNISQSHVSSIKLGAKRKVYD